MADNFQIGFCADTEILRNPPPKYRHLRLIFCPLGVKVDSLVFPGPGWCDFAGVLLLRWAHEIWNLSEERTRAARLIFFDTPSEIWVRRTPTRWWKVSCIVRTGKQKQVLAEALCTPERIEASVLSAIQRFLAGARQADVWGKDCEELAAFIDNPEGYVADTRDFSAEKAKAAHKSDPLPAALRARLRNSVAPNQQEPFPAPTGSVNGRSIEIGCALFPVLCPRCTAVLTP